MVTTLDEHNKFSARLYSQFKRLENYSGNYNTAPAQMGAAKVWIQGMNTDSIILKSVPHSQGWALLIFLCVRRDKIMNGF